MPAQITLRLRPFMLPNFVSVEGLAQPQADTTIAIEDLPRDTVEQLCDDFKANLLARYDKKREG